MAYSGPVFRIKVTSGETFFGKVRLSVTTHDVPFLPTIDKAAPLLMKEPEFVTIETNSTAVVVAKAAIVSVTPSDPDEAQMILMPSM